MGIEEVEELLEGARSLTHPPDSPQGDREQGTAGSSSTESSTTQDHPNVGTGLFISHKVRLQRSLHTRAWQGPSFPVHTSSIFSLSNCLQHLPY
jgi:hypothetical protein